MTELTTNDVRIPCSNCYMDFFESELCNDLCTKCQNVLETNYKPTLVLDFTRPLKTRGNSPVRIVHIITENDPKFIWVIMGFIQMRQGCNIIASWTKYGQANFDLTPGENDLVYAD